VFNGLRWETGNDAKEICLTALLPGFLVACGLLVAAGAAKLRAPSAAIGALGAAGLRVPSAGMRALGAAELAIGSLAAARPSAPTAAAVAALYAAFAVVVLRLVRSGAEASCGCFGTAGSQASPLHAALNAVACAAAIAAAVAPPPGVVWVSTQDPLIAVSLALGLAGSAFGAYLAFTALPGAWRAYGAGRP
jgi:hypothetical protein